MMSQRFFYYIVSLDTSMDDEDSDSHLTWADDSLVKAVREVPVKIPTIPYECPFQDSPLDCWQWNPSTHGPNIQLRDDMTVIFHPDWSNSTQAVRGTRLLKKKEMVYWEVVFTERVFGTAMMVGIGTPDTRLSSSSFEPLLGSDADSWGLSHKGYIYHNKQMKRYCDPFAENTRTVVGVLFDGRNGSVTFFKDGRSLGIAFRGLEECQKELYPMASSTAAKTVMELQNLRTCRAGMNLRDLCREAVLKEIGTPEDILGLPLAHPIKAFVFQHAWKTARQSCFVPN